MTTTIRRAALAAALLPAAAGAQDVAFPEREATFTVRIENISTPATLRLSNGTTAPAPTSPGVWVVHRGKNPIFTPGKYAGDSGLETQAEDGNPSALVAALGRRGVPSVGAFTTPVGQSMAGPLLPGGAIEFSFTATPGTRLSLALMFAQSNDIFIGNGKSGIKLFDRDGTPMSGDITGQLQLWDAGTEVNEEPGIGASQAPRQTAPNTGPAERRRVQLAREAAFGTALPVIHDVLRVTLTAGRGVQAAR